MTVTSFPPPASFVPSAMTKTTPTYAVTTSYGLVTGWLAETATYPGSSVSSNGLVAQAAKVGATCAASLVVTNAANAINCTLRLKLNGTVIATGTATSVTGFGSTTVAVSTTATVAASDSLTVEALAGFNSQLTIASNAASYVRIT